MSFLKCVNVRKVYNVGEVSIEALKDVSFQVDEGKVCVILGQSGAGKTTLLNIIGGMDQMTSGEIYLADRPLSTMTAKELTTYRRRDIGFVFQFYNLIQNLTAYENVAMATELVKNKVDPKEILDAVGLKDRINNFPSQLSGGEQQRVAIARAIAKRPKLLLCDEPTGALDYETGKHILQLLQDVSRQFNVTVLIITHNQAITPMAHQIVTMGSGHIMSSSINKAPTPIENIQW